MPRRKVIRGEGETRQRILDAAVLRFANASYDEVGLRDIAADVEVDVAYVHRCFGSKEGLFSEVVYALKSDLNFADIEPDELASVLSRSLIGRTQTHAAGEVEPLAFLVRSLLSPKAGHFTGERLQAEFIESLREKLEDKDPFRATMIVSLLIGLRIMRDLLQLPAAVDIDKREAELLLTQVLEGIIAIRIPPRSDLE